MQIKTEILVGQIKLAPNYLHVYVNILEEENGTKTGHVEVKLSNNQTQMILTADVLEEYLELMDQAHDVLMKRLKA